jgi:hypothetical protein
VFPLGILFSQATMVPVVVGRMEEERKERFNRVCRVKSVLVRAFALLKGLNIFVKKRHEVTFS